MTETDIREDLFSEDGFEEIIYTPNEFIEKAKEVLRKIDAAYSYSHHQRKDDDETPCSRCGGMCFIEQGGNVVDCPNCKGYGIEQTMVFDAEEFASEINDIFQYSDLYSLLVCEVSDFKSPNPPQP